MSWQEIRAYQVRQYKWNLGTAGGWGQESKTPKLPVMGMALTETGCRERQTLSEHGSEQQRITH